MSDNAYVGGSLRPVIVLLCALILVLPALAASMDDSAPITVIGVAQDVQAVVIDDGQGQTRKYSHGEAIGASGWQVRRIGHDFVMLENAQNFQGKPLLLRVGAGERADLRAMSSTKENEPRPVMRPASVAVHGIKERAQSAH